MLAKLPKALNMPEAWKTLAIAVEFFNGRRAFVLCNLFSLVFWVKDTKENLQTPLPSS